MSLQTASAPYPPSGEDVTFPWAFTLGQYPVAVYGLGKMGLPLAAVYAATCGNVTGVDVDESVVETISSGRSPVDEPGLDALVERTVNGGSLRATTDGQTAATDATIHVIVVPTLVEDGEPDLSLLDAALDTVATGLEAGDCVFVESTVPPRTCEDHVVPRLAAASGLEPGEFGVAFCPERTMSGRALDDIRGTHPKIVGGVDDASTELAARVYGEITDAEVVPVSSATTAEAVKVFEGLYRDVNIALANELAQFTDDFGIDVLEAIEAANTQPFCDIHTPGAGVGGHCIPYYPYFVLGEFDRDAPLLRTARAVNDEMPVFVAETLLERVARLDRVPSTDGRPDEATVAVLGLTYRAGVEEVRATPARPIAATLADTGATVLGVDPLVDDLEAIIDDDLPGVETDAPEGFAGEVIEQDALYDRDLDGVVLVTAHDEFDEIDWSAFDEPLAVVDGRQALDLDGTDHEGTDHDVYTIGGGAA